jgi:hypothetical protein
MCTRWAVLFFVAALAVVPLASQPRLSRQDADHFQSKLSKIVQFGKAAPLRSAQPRSTAVTDAELNSYLRYAAGPDVPAGIVEPTLNAVGNGRVAGSAIVDLDVVRTQQQRGWLDPLAYMSGRLPVTAAGTLTTSAGKGQFQLESAEISGVTVPKAVLQELLTHYSRSADKPQGINMDDPFELPARIREIRVGTGIATVVQ